jgi:hypothetical protein
VGAHARALMLEQFHEGAGREIFRAVKGHQRIKESRD